MRLCNIPNYITNTHIINGCNMGGVLAFSFFLSTVATTVPPTHDIYISMEGRREIRIAPNVDTMKTKVEYIYKITLDPEYKFSELYCDRGLAYRTDKFLHITSHSTKTSGIDTVTLRVVLFGNNRRVLMYKYFYVKIDEQLYPKAEQNPKEYVAIDNLLLERNMAYPKLNFHPQSVFHYIVHESRADVTHKVLSVNISLVNSGYNKTFTIQGNILTKDVLAEIHKQKIPTQAYIRLKVQVGDKQREVWSRFIIPG